MNEMYTDLAVAGLHLTGQPLNNQLVSLGAKLKMTCNTSACYHMYLIEDAKGMKPGLIRLPYNGQGNKYIVEVWEIPSSNLGTFLSNIPAPLGLGKVLLEDGSTINGFICEPRVLMEGKDISQFSGWKDYLLWLEKVN